MLSGKPRRIISSAEVLHALSEIENIDVVRTEASPFVLYLEGEDDERLLSAWADKLGRMELFRKFYPYALGGGNKKQMRERADRHYRALKQIVPHVKRALLFDFDSDEEAFHPTGENIQLNEWKRKNIDNYLLVPSAWKRAVARASGENENSLFLQPFYHTIDNLFNSENLTLPTHSTWKNVKANIFKLLDGKKLLFEQPDSLFEKIKKQSKGKIKLDRSTVAGCMEPDEIHEDIEFFLDNLEKVVVD
jgi:hypothetical protein